MRWLRSLTVLTICACPGEHVPAGTTSGTTSGAIDEATTGEAAGCGEPIAEDQFAARFAAAICAQKAACGCDVDDQCLYAFTYQFEAVRRHARVNAPHYDAACAGAVLHDRVQARGCAVRSQWYEGSDCAQGCEVFRGDVPLGGACGESTVLDSSAFMDVCAGVDNYCGVLGTATCASYDAVPTVGPGEECLSADRLDLSWCQDGYWCSLNSSVCVPEVGLDQSCGDFAECSADAWCDLQGLCRPQKPAGAPCGAAAECASQECTAGACDDFVIVCRVDSPADLVYPFAL